MQKIINEGQLRFTFPGNWAAIKYDETFFYRDNIIPTGANLKAVDILVANNAGSERILMLEVKDFRDHAKENEHGIVSGELVIEVIEKALHTLAGLHLAKYCGKNELAGFTKNELNPPAKIELILFLEENIVDMRFPNDTRNKLRRQNKEKRLNDMELSLRQKLKHTIKITSKVLNTERLEKRHGFIVTAI